MHRFHLSKDPYCRFYYITWYSVTPPEMLNRDHNIISYRLGLPAHSGSVSNHATETLQTFSKHISFVCKAYMFRF